MKGFRWFLSLIGITLLSFSIVLVINELYLWFLISLLGSILSLGYAIFYYPMSSFGLETLYEWRALQKQLPSITDSEWEKLSSDQQQILSIYAIGINSPFMEQSPSFNELNLDNKQNPFSPSYTASYSSIDPMSMYMIGIFASSHFYSANKDVEKTFHSANGSSGAGSGGGVGGGGGGSGAF